MNLFNDRAIRYIFRCDDIGMCHASNMALERVLKHGVVTAVSVMVISPWLDEAVSILQNYPQVSVGLHTALTAEWATYRWGPVLPPGEVPSLVDEWGKFRPTPEAVLAHRPDPDQVERELRAQLDLAMRKGLRLSYMDSHMGAVTYTPELRQRFQRVGLDYGLGLSEWFGEVPGPEIWKVPPERKLDTLLDGMAKTSTPGLYLVVCHPSVKSPEACAVLRGGNADDAVDQATYRHAEMEMLCHPRLARFIAERGIELLGYATLRQRK